MEVVETNYLDELKKIDKECVSWGDTVHYQDNPIVAKTCQGQYVYDVNGTKYIDSGMWHSSCNFGYRNENIEAYLRKALNTLPQINGDFLHENKLLLAQMVTKAIYERTGIKGRVSFNVGGSLVVEDALKIVRKNKGKNKVAVMMGSYHGRSLELLNLSSSHRYREYFNEFPYRAEMFPYANCSQCYYEKEIDNCNMYCSKMIRKAFSNEFHGLATEQSCELGAVIVEACQGRGYTIPPKDFFKEFIPEMRKKGMLIIADEIQTGMYRTGKLFAFEHFGFTPDIITLSKSFTNGLNPISMVWAREDLVSPDVFSPGHAHSNFANNPLGTASAFGAWNYMLSRDYEKKVPQQGRKILHKLNELKEQFHFIYNVDGLGLLLNIMFADSNGVPYKNSATLAAAIAQDNDFYHNNEELRLILQVGGSASNVLKFAPYLDITDQEIEQLVAVLKQVLAKLELVLPVQSKAQN